MEDPPIYTKNHEIYIGSRIGTLIKCTTNASKKDTKTGKTLKELRNLMNTCETDIGVAISSMCWANDEHSEILFSQCNNSFRTYNVINDSSKFVYRTSHKSAAIGVQRFNDVIASCTETGNLTLWENTNKQKELDVGKNVEVFSQCSSTKNLLVVAGKNNNTKIWDAQTEKCTFTAKNEPHDSLQMEIPIWVSGAAFMPQDSSLLATTCRYGKVRLYDQRAQRRPVTIVNVETALTTISPCHKQMCMIIGTTTGTMQLIDLRANGKALNTYKDFAGSVTAITCDETDPYVISVALDRHLRVHHLDTKKLVYKVFIKNKPSSMLVRTVDSKVSDKSSNLEDPENQSDTDSDDCLSTLPIIQ